MKFSSSDVSSITEKPSLIEDIDFQCNTDTTSFPVADKLRGVNKALHDVVNLILEAQSEEDFDDSNYTDFPISTTGLVANQQDYNTNTLIPKLLKIQRVEITYDGTNWHKVNPIDLGEIGIPTDTTTISNNFSTANPYYDYRNGSLFLYPIPTSSVAGGLKIWYLREPDEFTKSDTTQEPGFHEMYHPLISYKTSLEYLTAKGLNDTKQKWLSEQVTNLEGHLKIHYGSKHQDRHLRLSATNENYE